MIIMFLGDTHGNRGFTYDAITLAKDLGVDRIVQVGDFGYWPRTEYGKRFLHEVGKFAQQNYIPFYWIAGNHEDHDSLDQMVGDGPIKAFHHGKHLTHIQSGSSWEWDGVTFGALGGAFSIDRSYRTEHSYAYGWFPQEVPDPDLILGIGKVDVLITHDAPEVPPHFQASGNFRVIEGSQDSVRAVSAALSAARPTWLVHGHWHTYYRSRVDSTEVWGLDCDRSVTNATCIFDTEHRQMYSLSQWMYVREENDAREKDECNGTSE